jgi:hypothetical protein
VTWLRLGLPSTLSFCLFSPQLLSRCSNGTSVTTRTACLSRVPSRTPGSSSGKLASLTSTSCFRRASLRLPADSPLLTVLSCRSVSSQLRTRLQIPSDCGSNVLAVTFPSTLKFSCTYQTPQRAPRSLGYVHDRPPSGPVSCRTMRLRPPIMCRFKPRNPPLPSKLSHQHHPLFSLIPRHIMIGLVV